MEIGTSRIDNAPTTEPGWLCKGCSIQWADEIYPDDISSHLLPDTQDIYEVYGDEDYKSNNSKDK